jgi:hypothetical protein
MHALCRKGTVIILSSNFLNLPYWWALVRRLKEEDRGAEVKMTTGTIVQARCPLIEHTELEACCHMG